MGQATPPSVKRYEKEDRQNPDAERTGRGICYPFRTLETGSHMLRDPTPVLQNLEVVLEGSTFRRPGTPSSAAHPHPLYLKGSVRTSDTCQSVGEITANQSNT